jgi:hypothetical protein
MNLDKSFDEIGKLLRLQTYGELYNELVSKQNKTDGDRAQMKDLLDKYSALAKELGIKVTMSREDLDDIPKSESVD